MKRRAIAIATGLALAPTAHAIDLTWYGGGALQRSTLHSDFDFVAFPPGSGTSGDDSAEALKLFGGIRRPLEWGFYGAELGIGFGGAKIEGNFRSGLEQRGVIEEDRSISLSFVAGLSVRPDTDIFGRIGLVRTSFDFRSLSTAGAEVASGDDDFTDIELALGVDHWFTRNLALRLEISRVDYSDDFEIVGNVTGDLAKFDDVSRDAISIGIFTTF